MARCRQDVALSIVKGHEALAQSVLSEMPSLQVMSRYQVCLLHISVYIQSMFSVKVSLN